jgi:hypothetical protein
VLLSAFLNFKCGLFQEQLVTICDTDLILIKYFIQYIQLKSWWTYMYHRSLIDGIICILFNSYRKYFLAQYSFNE